MSVANVVAFCALVILWLSCEVEVAVCGSEGEIVLPWSEVGSRKEGGGVSTHLFSFRTRERVRLGRDSLVPRPHFSRPLKKLVWSTAVFHFRSSASECWHIVLF